MIFTTVKCLFNILKVHRQKKSYLFIGRFLLGENFSYFRITTGVLVEKVFELCKFQVLVQKDGHLLNSDTQVHECRAKYSAQLAPWISPLSWLVQKIEKVGIDAF